MEKNQLFEKLNDNLQNINIIENEMAMIEFAIYQKNIEKIKINKLNEIRELFEQQSKLYNQKIEKYKTEIDKNIKAYSTQMDKLIKIYDDFYVTTFKMMNDAINNQKIAVTNIIILSKKINDTDVSESERQKMHNTLIACAQKKLNYAVIIDECKARIKWCIENAQKDINEVFINNMNQLQIYKENIVNKIRRLIFNKVSGKKRYKTFLKNYEIEYMKDIKSNNKLRILDVISTLKGVIKQIKETKKQILVKYEEML